VAFFWADHFIGRKDGILAKRTRKTAPAENKVETKDSAAKAFALAAARLARDRHCSDIVVLDLHGVSPAADFFVIATGTSDRQMRSLADEISQEGRKTGFGRFGRAGYDQAHWILLDYIDVVVHLFTEECRQYYDLEMLWSDAERVPIDD
jgi:ribosome-associated protein